MLADLELGDNKNIGTEKGCIALDCSVRKTKQDHYAISTTDFFFPLVDSPYLQGFIGAANVLSDLYALGVEDCDYMLMLLAACREMPENERSICTREMIKGFRDACAQAGAPITGGQTVLNPWPIIGGVATSIVSDGEFVLSNGAKDGDLVVLTKPLGTQVAVNVHQWKQQDNDRWKQCCEEGITKEAAESMMHEAVCSMARLNRNAARLMLRYGATAATDVTGFGILGHAQNLSENQVQPVSIEIHTLPCIAGTPAVNQNIMNFRLLQGFSAETSGGLLLCIPEATQFCDALQKLDGSPSWIIGRVVSDKNRKARILEDFQVLEV